MNIKDDVAVIGMAGRFPGASSVREFWQNLCAKKEGIRRLSDDQLRLAGVPERDIADSLYVRSSASLDDFDRFDPGFFKMSPVEAELMDPQIRLLLQCAWEALEDAGHARKEAQNIGVFAGAGGVTTSYLSNFVNLDPRFERTTAGPAHLGNDKDFLATYISYKLNLTGPSMTVQTACSTSLVALHQARASVLSGECDMALAGGVTVRVPHGHGYRYKEGYIFSRSGSIRTFDEGADGVVFGSGLGLVLIRRLSDALRDGDPVYAVIKGSAIGNDGKGKMSYAASSARGQIACVRAALENAAVDAGSIGFVESHGTGTAMGDPEEVKALSAAFKNHTDKKAYCALGAVKTNIGHLEAAAGIAGFIKAVLVVRHGLIPPTLHYEKPNPRIRFEHTPFYVNRELLAWDAGEHPRRAAVNSLGVGGTNAFVIVEQHATPARPAGEATAPFVVPLSAKTEASLRAYTKRLADFLASDTDAGEAGDLARIAYTLQTGREAMERRAAFVVSTVEELKASLDGYLLGLDPQGHAAQGDPAGDDADEAKVLAAAWAAGAEVDWLKLHRNGTPQRIHLPTYVFAKDRYWIDAAGAGPSRPVIHPLLHTNTSDLNEQRYSATFTGEEFFLLDHQVRTRQRTSGTGETASPSQRRQKILPGVAYLEMARAAIEHAAPAHRDGGALELRGVVWLQPIAVAQDKQVNIAVLPRHGADDAAGKACGEAASRIDFEVYTDDDQIHCQGQCRFSRDAAALDRIDVAALKAAMRRGRQSADEIYRAFDKMGLHYGPAHRSITAVERGDRQLLAHVALPEALSAGEHDYVLHPSLMDGALQAATTLLFDPHDVPGHPIVPFALDVLCIVAPCKPSMDVWVRFAPESHFSDKSARLDIDLLDADGKICVQMRGFTPRALGQESLGSLLATQTWQASRPAAQAAAHAQRHVIVCDLPQLDVPCIGPDRIALQLDRAKTLGQRYADLALACFDKLKALIAAKPTGSVLVQLVLPDTAEHAVYAGLSGLFKTARLEHPRVAGQIVFAAPDIGTGELERLLQAESGHPHDTLIRHAQGERQVAGWAILQDEEGCAFDRDGPFKEHGVYLITGGLGGLGVLFANEILARTARATIVLTGRAPWQEIMQSARRKAILESLQAGGATVEYSQVDLCDRDDVQRLVAAVLAKHERLNGVIHSAGLTSDALILKKMPGEFRRVLEPKTTGTENLDEATRGVDLDFMVLFSSLTSAAGNLGQADYAAANGFLDTFAAHRNRLVKANERRGATLAIRWPLWQDGGIQPGAAARDLLHETTGIYPMVTATGMRMFCRSLALGVDQTLVMEGDLHLMRRTLGIGAARHAAAIEQDPPRAEAVADGDLAEVTERYLGRQLASMLKLASDKVDARAPLQDYGIDSILALDLTLQLEKTFGALPKTLFFEYLTIRELAGYFVKSHAARLAALFAAADTGTAAPKPAEAPAGAAPICVSLRSGSRRHAQGAGAPAPAPEQVIPEPIAIVGLSGRYSGSRDVRAFWRQLRDGKDCIVEVPKDRWDWHDYYSDDRSEKGHHFSRWGGFIEGVDEFDARFFNISPVEAALIDPQERLFLQHAWLAIEDAGCTRAAMQVANADDLAGQVGVYAGVMYGEYQLFGAEASLQGRRMGFASNLASIANRVSYVLNVHGPSMVVDTMCSSSLTAIHLACQDLKLGRTSMAIAGGVNVTIHPNKYLMLSAGQFISGDGHCQSFGEGGDGYIPGEGVGVVVLKRLADARRDGNRIYGVIKGSALSHGGRTNGYTVPNPQAQASAIRRALHEARVAARHVSYIEAHGTGTKLGDPIEIAALSKVFGENTQDTGFCRIGSAKSNIGHAEAAAGIAGLTKVLLQLQHRSIVPSLHSSRLNPHIDFDNSPFVVNQSLTPWEAPVIDGRRLPRIAGISSFGAGGSNAHLIVEEYSPPVAAARPRDGVECIVPLSARTPEQLRQKARDLVEFVRAETADACGPGEERPLSFVSLAYTLQVGREAMDERVAVVADSLDGLVGRLQCWLDGEACEGIHQAQVKAHKDTLSLLEQDPDLSATIAKWIAARHHARLADLWAKGLALDWGGFHAVRPALISLPGYPFARQRHWVDAAVTGRQAPRGPSATALHPLVHRNTSDFDEQSYASTFAGDELFIVGDPGRRCLSEAACLEMARAAVELAMPSRQASRRPELRDIAWAQPGIALGDGAMRVALFDRIGEQAAFEIHSGESVHCQGRAAFCDVQGATSLDLGRIRAQDPQALRELPACPVRDDTTDGLVLHPTLIQQALQDAARLAGGTPHPVAMASLRVLSSSSRATLAWTRLGADHGVDIDLCDELGAVCVQMRGLRYAAGAVVETPAAVDAPPREAQSGEVEAVQTVHVDAAFPGGVCIPFDAMPGSVADHAASAKPSRSIQLAPETAAAVARQATPSHKPTVTLSTLRSGSSAGETRVPSSVTLFDRGHGVYAIRVDAPASDNSLSPDVIADFLRAMRAVEHAPSAKVLMLEGTGERFLTGGIAQHRDMLASHLYGAVAEFPYPVIAVVRGDAVGAGFLVAAVSDFMVCGDSARLSFALPEQGLFPSAAEALLSERFGRVHACDLLWLSERTTGADLKLKGWTCPIVPSDRVNAFAHDLATNLAGKTQTSLRLLKQHLARRIVAEVRALPAPGEPASPPDDAVPRTADLIEPPSARIQLQPHGDRILVVKMCAHEEGHSADALLADLETLFARLDGASPYRCVVLSSEIPGFLPDVPAEATERLARAYAEALLGFGRPIVAALNGDAHGLAWFVAQHCDACVHSRDGRYSIADVPCEAPLDGATAGAISLRLGDEAAKRLLLAGGMATGAELRDLCAALHVVGAGQVPNRSLAVAAALARFPAPVLQAWKRRTASMLQAQAAQRVHQAMPLSQEVPARNLAPAPVELALASKVMAAVAHPEGILEVRMADGEAKNGFSGALSSGMREVFSHVENNTAIKVVVLTGYDNFFSSGGTRDTLMAIHEGKARFTDNTVFQLPLTCSVPVIAAMQGHGLGAGWALGAYADATIYSDESRYRSPYMDYGFTPGAGATLLFPGKIGHDLARETLLTAREYSGGELRERGLVDPVWPRERVLPMALALARRMAQQPRSRLVALKQRWVAGLRASVQQAFDRELAMHERTFVGNAGTLRRIKNHFGTEAASGTPSAPPLSPSASRPQPQPQPRSHGADLAGIAASLKQLLAHELRMLEDEIDDDEQFVDLGLDSITGVTWIRSINEKYGTAIEAIKVYSHPTLAQLSRFVREEAMRAGTLAAAAPAAEPAGELRGGATQASAAPALNDRSSSATATASVATAPLVSWRHRSRTTSSAARTATAAGAEPIAIVGMSGQFAKARNLDEFWHNIAQGRDCIDEVPTHRWDIDRYYQPGEVVPGKTTSRWMGALDEPDRFDAAFFNISPREARSMDPQQRLFLQACWHGIEHAGYNPKALAGSRCGVFVGCSAGDYHQLCRREQLSGQGFTGAAASILAARISYFLDLHGPSLSIDTACSSSLVAVATSCDNLAAGHCDIALAGGVNVMAGPAMQIMTSQVGMLSPHGRCFTFDDRANGIVNGEGVGVVMLKRLSDARRDGDCIYGVVEGWGVNQDGKTNGITAPNADSQTRLQQEVYDRFGVDPAGIQLVEAHGTGTALGDPIEVAALKASFAKYTRRTGYCALGSVKSNIGHCLTAAGVSGLLKVLLALQHQQLPPTIHFRRLNRHISLQGSPFYVNDRLRDWKRDGHAARRAAVSSFGFSGTNAHVVIAEYPGPQDTVGAAEPTIVPLSAKSADQLARQARELLAFVRSDAAAGLELRRLAYTLQVGREPMNERVAFLAGTVAELETALQGFVDGDAPAGRAARGHVDGKDTLVGLGADPDFQAMVSRWIGRRELPRLADLWVKGVAFDWSAFYAESSTPRRVGLPVYPFAKERHWIETVEEAVAASQGDRSCTGTAASAAGTAPSAATPVPASQAAAPQDAAPAGSPVARHTVPDHAVPAAEPMEPGPSMTLRQLRGELKASLAEALFMQPSDVDVRKPFTELGLDSIIGVEWVKAINRQYGTAVAATRIYDHPSIHELADYLHAELGHAAVSPRNPGATVAQILGDAPAARPEAESAVSRVTLQAELQASLAEVLFMRPGDVDLNTPFTQLGLDSIIGVEWVKAINKRYATCVSATRIYDHPTVKELAAFLQGEMPPRSAAPAGPAASAASTPAPTASRGIRSAPEGATAGEGLHFRIAGSEGDLEREGQFSVRCSLSPDTNVCLKEHVVFGEHLLPTDAYIELVIAAYRTRFAGEGIGLRNIAIANPVIGADGRDTHLRVVFRRARDGLQFFVKSSASPDFRDETLNMQGFVAAMADVLQSRFDDPFAVEKTLQRHEITTNTGTFYAPLQSLQFGPSAALGIIRVAAHEFGFVANPFLLYGGLCTAINYGGHLGARHHGGSDDQFLPYRIGRIAFAGAMEGADFRCCVRLRKLERDAVELDFDIVDGTGRAVVAVDSIVLRRVARATITGQAAAARRRPGVEPVRATRAVGARAEKVAIIGMSCRYPMSENVDAFWQNLKDGRDCITEVPADRWGAQEAWYHPDPRHPNTSYSKWGGFLDRIDAFDPLFFGIAPAEAELIDPQQRIFLEQCWKAIESAGHAPGTLSNRSCGVYVGCGGGDYARVLAQTGHDAAGAAFMGTSSAILAARISYLLNLKGPALAVDTACSSSLVAVHLACESIRNGDNELALAGGINLLTTPIGHILTSQVGMPSRDGRCAPFDASANGIVFSEGCGVLLLKSLSAALRDNDDILGVIQGSGTNQDGKTNGITAPSAKAQERLLRQVYDSFGIDPSRIGYVEAHGTATALGDPIEVQALSSAFGPGDAEPAGVPRCALGSVKSNIGHTGFAAGVAGIIKALLCIRHRKLVPSLHYRQANPHIDFERSPFRVETQYRDWVSDQPRLAAVSSFGFSGTNAHVVIEEHVAQAEPTAAAAAPKCEAFVPLSAKTAEQLQQVARDLLQALRGREERVDEPVYLARLAYTLQVGRDAMDHRLGVVAVSAGDLADKLQAWLAGQARIDGVHRGQASLGDDTLALFAADADMRRVIDGWVAQKKLDKIADLWVKGFELDLNRLHDGPNPRRMALPTYPFARERCWVEAAGTWPPGRGGTASALQGGQPRASDGRPTAAGRSEAPTSAVAVLHPLLQRNTSNLGRQSYTSVFSGDEFFLADHRVGGRRVLPAVACLEMARAALTDAMPQEMASRHVELQHVVWAQPIVVGEIAHVTIDVYAEDAAKLGFEICSRHGEHVEEILHCQGTGVLVDRPAPQRLDLAGLRAQMQRPALDAGMLYPMFGTLGLDYGPAFQGIVAVQRGEGTLLVELSLPDALRAGRPYYVLHPSLMDSALQGSLTLIDDVVRACGKPSLPFALESLRIFSACTDRMVAWVRYADGAAAATAGLVKVDIDLCDADGQVCVQLRGFSSRSAASVPSLDDVAAEFVTQYSRR